MSATTHPNVYNGTLLDNIIHEQKLSRKLVKKAAREILVIIKEGLLRDGVVRIKHFGSFKLKRVAARKGRNPQTGEVITIPERTKVIFKPCKALREMIEPVHARPVPVPVPAVTELAQAKKAITEAILPEPVPEPAILKTASQPGFAIDQPGSSKTEHNKTDGNKADDNKAAVQVSEGRKKNGQDKLIYFGIAASIIAVVAIRSIPQTLEAPAQSVAAPELSKVVELEPFVIAELEAKPVEIAPMPDSSMATPSKEPVTAEAIESPAVLPVTTTPTPEQAQIATEFFFTGQSYSLLAGNNLWQLSKHFYNEPLYWPYIFYSNSDTIINPDKLPQGRTISLPSLEGQPGNLTAYDRKNIAEGYFLVYTFYKENGHPDAIFALLEAKRYSAEVVERNQHTLTLSGVEHILLNQQEESANL